MGGPCWIVLEPADSANKKDAKRERAPPCTDNFQYVAFQYKGKQWMSAEQCYQAQKFLDPQTQEVFRLCLKQSAKETDYEHGMRIWREGQEHFRNKDPDWERNKVDIMLAINLAKYESNPQLQAELLATGNFPIEGANSTSWKHPKMGMQNWSYWNGIIQMKCREMCKPEDKRNTEFLKEFDEILKKYRDGFSS